MGAGKVIRWEACREGPWKNGGGITREVISFPAQTGAENFLWRLSIARVDVPGMFSTFPEMLRVLAVAEGKLSLAGPGIAAELDTYSGPFRFFGDVAVQASPVNGSALNINAMAKRARFSIDMERLGAGEAIANLGTTLFVATEEQAFAGVQLGRFDCVVLSQSASAGGCGLRVSFVPVELGER